MLVPVGSEEGKYHAVEQVRVLFLNTNAGTIDVKKRAMVSDQAVRGYFYLRLADGYQVGNSANKGKESLYYPECYRECVKSAPVPSHGCIMLRTKA
jgi:hypothetical protein